MITALTIADAASDYMPAKSGIYLSDRQLFALFERVCTETGVGNWTGWSQHFAVIAEDIRTELQRVLFRATVEIDLRHALRIIAWTWERECVTS